MTDHTQHPPAADPTPTPTPAAPGPGPGFLSPEDQERIARLTARADARYGADAKNQAVLERGLRLFRSLVMRRDGDRWRVAKSKVLAYAVSGAAVVGFWNYWPRPSFDAASASAPSVGSSPASLPPVAPPPDAEVSAALEGPKPEPAGEVGTEDAVIAPPALPSPRLELERPPTPEPERAAEVLAAPPAASYDPYEREAPTASYAPRVEVAVPVLQPEPFPQPEPLPQPEPTFPALPTVAPIADLPAVPLEAPPVATGPAFPVPVVPEEVALPPLAALQPEPRVAPSPAPLVQRRPTPLVAPTALVDRLAPRPAVKGASALVDRNLRGRAALAVPLEVERDERSGSEAGGPLVLEVPPSPALLPAAAVAAREAGSEGSSSSAPGAAGALLSPAESAATPRASANEPLSTTVSAGVLVDAGAKPGEEGRAVSSVVSERSVPGAGGALVDTRRASAASGAPVPGSASIAAGGAVTQGSAGPSPYRPGTRLAAKLTVGVIALAGREAPVVAALEDGSTAFGTARLDETGRVEVIVREVLKDGTTTVVSGTALGPEGYGGLKGQVREEGADLLGQLVDVSLKGVSDYAQGLARSSTTTVANGVTTITQAGADLGWSLLGGLASALAPSQGQQRVRFVELKAGTEFQVLFLPAR